MGGGGLQDATNTRRNDQQLWPDPLPAAESGSEGCGVPWDRGGMEIQELQL